MKPRDDPSGRICAWLTERFPLARRRHIGLDDSLLDSGIIDSLGTLDVVQFLEDEFGCEVSDEEMVADNFESIRSIARFVDSKRGRDGGDAED